MITSDKNWPQSACSNAVAEVNSFVNVLGENWSSQSIDGLIGSLNNLIKALKPHDLHHGTENLHTKTTVDEWMGLYISFTCFGLKRARVSRGKEVEFQHAQDLDIGSVPHSVGLKPSTIPMSQGGPFHDNNIYDSTQTKKWRNGADDLSLENIENWNIVA